MQGTITVTENWSEINTLGANDINGDALTLSVASGDTLKFYDMSASVLLWQGAQPTADAVLGSIPLIGNGIMGVGTDKVYLKSVDGTRKVTFELVKGA